MRYNNSQLNHQWTSQSLLNFLHLHEVIIVKFSQAHIIPTLHPIALLNQPVYSQIWQSRRLGRYYLILRPKVVHVPCNRHHVNIILDLCRHLWRHPSEAMCSPAFVPPPFHLYLVSKYLSSTCIHFKFQDFSVPSLQYFFSSFSLFYHTQRMTASCIPRYLILQYHSLVVISIIIFYWFSKDASDKVGEVTRTWAWVKKILTRMEPGELISWYWHGIWII